MKKESLGWYSIRLILSAAIFALMLMVYWSSILVENNMLKVSEDLKDVKQGLSEIKKQLANGHYSSNGSATPSHSASRPHIDASLPNLLQKDPYYAVTLPKILGKDFKPGGTIHNASFGVPDNLSPMNNYVPVPELVGLCVNSLADSQFGKFESMAPGLAIKIEERINPDTRIPEFWVHLRDDLYWQPLKKDMFPAHFELAEQFLVPQPVTSEDFKFYVDAFMNPAVSSSGAVALRTLYESFDEFVIVDPLTFIVRWKPGIVQNSAGKEVKKIKYMARFQTASLKPLPSFVYKYLSDGKKIIDDKGDPSAYATSTVWAQNFNEHWAKKVIVGCSSWIFESFNERQIDFKRNPLHYEPLAALIENMVVSFKDSQDAIVQQFKAGQIDDMVAPPDKIAEIEDFMKSNLYLAQQKAGKAIKRIDYVTRMYRFIGLNEENPLFKSAKVRRALTMAIDRNRIIEQFLDGMGIPIHGPSYVYSSESNPNLKPLPYDPQQAKRMLEEEGWIDLDGDGILDKEIDGKRVLFEFSIMYYVKNNLTRAICEFISSSLHQLGISCKLRGVDIADFSHALDEKDFDAFWMAWVLNASPTDPRQLWYSTLAKVKGSSNIIGFQNKRVDEIIDKLDYAYDPNKRKQLYHEFDRIIHEEAPYLFLFTPKEAFYYREYLKGVFIPAERQDLIPGADVGEPISAGFWMDLTG